MGRPVKIRKKKSFMFTTRHYSFLSIMGIVAGVMSGAATAASFAASYAAYGKVGAGFGGIGMFSLLLSIVGVICGTLSTGERDIYIAPAIAAIVMNGILILGWVALILISVFA
ncbi:MAG: DUF6142 family protein [Lachnospiraceae bacterium]|nr:DUF6142 family protein [Lachnospiraceae bacterium]